MERVHPICLHCAKVINNGRADKKFCDYGCKDAYYNEQKSSELREIRRVNLALKNNRRILKKKLGTKEEIIFSRQGLLEAGFKFDYHTHHVISKIKEYEYIFCFDYGYRVLRPGQYKIVKSFDKAEL